MDYQALTQDEQVAIIDNRIRDLERDHLSATVRAVAPLNGVQPSQEQTAVDTIAAKLDKLRNMRTEVLGGTK